MSILGKACILALLAMLVAPSASARPSCDVVATAKALNATTFLTVVTDAGLAPAVTDTKFTGTIFVPTNEALAAALKAYPNLTADQIKSILLYHVATKPYSAKALIKAKSAATLLKPQKLKVAVKKGKVNIIGAGSTATVLKANLCAPGCKVQIHSIDTVLVPKL